MSNEIELGKAWQHYNWTAATSQFVYIGSARKEARMISAKIKGRSGALRAAILAWSVGVFGIAYLPTAAQAQKTEDRGHEQAQSRETRGAGAMTDSSETTRASSRRTIEAFFNTKERHDFEGLAALFADDIVYTFPLPASGAQENWFVYDGKKATNEYQRMTLDRFSKLSMLDKQINVSHDGSAYSLNLEEIT